ncbi:Mitogen-activated protein kinase [Entomortierella chlamydospora]|nr:Mitogen-activated protein kinase [Entomortierella chlamydospora]
MSQSQGFPKLGYPCMATGASTASLVGLEYAAPGDSKNASYTIQSYTLPTKNLPNVSPLTFTAGTTIANSVKPLSNSRMLCSLDEASGTFLYIFNDNVYLNAAKSTVISAWDSSRASAPQVIWPNSSVEGQFQWLGLIGGNWTTIDISAANGVSTPTPATVPKDVPTTGVYSIFRETTGSFLVLYNQNSNATTAARFNLTDAASTPLTLASPDIGYIHFSSVANAQDSSSDYFFGSDGKSTYTASAALNSSTIRMISTRHIPSDQFGPVPQLYDYGASTTVSNGKILIYGGLSNPTNNTWDFSMSMVVTNTGNSVDFNNYTIFSGDKTTTSGSFVITTPVPTTAPVQSKGLSTPAIIGIAIGAVALVMLIALFAVFHSRNKKIKARAREQEGLDMAVRDMHAKGAGGMAAYQPGFASTHSLLASEANTARGPNSVSTEQPVENLTLRVPIVRYDGRDVAQSVPYAPLGAVVLSQYRLGQTAVNSKMVVIQLGENVDTAESVTLKWVRDEIVWQREAAMLNHIVNPAKIISLHQTMIIPAALEWRHILVLDAHESTLDFMLSTHHQRILNRPDQMAVIRALLGGLVWCHEKDVIHLSICTGSLVMNEEGNWVIWSFGGARFLNEAVGPRQGSMIGQENGSVERNLAPELLNARRDHKLDSTLATTAMDAWAAGCVLFEVLTGQPLFRTEEAADQASTGRFSAWKDRLMEIQDPKERNVVEGLLHLDPNYRLSLSQAESLFV